MKKLLGVMLTAVLLTGCAGGGNVDGNKSVEEIAEAVKSMDMAQIEAKIASYKKAIEAKSAELEPVLAKLKEIPVTKLMGDEAKAIKADVAEIKDAVKVLEEKMRVYVKALQDLK